MSLIVDIEKKLGSFTLRSRFETGSGTMALLGASGCGKSVTLKCIAGIMTPDKGRIILDGETLFDSQKHIDLTPQQRRVGYLFQQYALFPNMTVIQNIQCGIRTGSRSEKQQRAAEQLRRFQLEGLEKKYPAQLSGGQQQRVALARILASEPRVGVIRFVVRFRRPDSVGKPRSWGMLSQLPHCLRNRGRYLFPGDGYGGVDPSPCYPECGAAYRLPQFSARSSLRGWCAC